MEGDSSVHSPYPDVVDTIKAITTGVMENSHLSNVFRGKVTSVSPLEISINNQVTLSGMFLILTNAVKDHDVDIMVSWETVNNTHQHENGNDGKPTDEHTHNHMVWGRKRITIYNGLTMGEEVLLLRLQGGQDYVVLDRITPHKTTGENL